MSPNMKTFEDAIETAKAEFAKAEIGNKAAGVRSRKALKEVIQAAQALRKEVIELRDKL